MIVMIVMMEMRCSGDCVGSGHCLKTSGGGCVTKASAVKYIT